MRGSRGRSHGRKVRQSLLPSFWEHMDRFHPEGWLTCRCPGFMGAVPELENAWLAG